jgi:hypothetical protein
MNTGRLQMQASSYILLAGHLRKTILDRTCTSDKGATMVQQEGILANGWSKPVRRRSGRC